MIIITKKLKKNISKDYKKIVETKRIIFFHSFTTNPMTIKYSFSFKKKYFAVINTKNSGKLFIIPGFKTYKRKLK